MDGQKTGKTYHQNCDCRDEIHDAEGVMMKVEQVIIPSTMRKEMLKKVHEGGQQKEELEKYCIGQICHK